MGHKNMSFIGSSGVVISFQKIIIIGGIIFTMYFYGKFIIYIYNYLHSKIWPKKDPSQAINVRAKFLINSFKNTYYTF
jgi:hypothetical protein